MSVRTTVVLFVIAVLLTSYAVLIESNRIPEGRGTGQMFPDVEPADIVEISLVYQGEDAAERAGVQASAGSGEPPTITLRRDERDAWGIVAPIEFSAHGPRVQGLVWAIADLVQVDRIPEGTEAWSRAIPADGPPLTVRFRTRQGEERAIDLGIDYPEATLDYIYLRVREDGEESVHVTRGEFRTTFAVGLDDLRSRALFPIAPVDARELSIRASEDAYSRAFRRDSASGRWVFDGGGELDGTFADREAVRELIDVLNAWGIVEFERDGAGVSDEGALAGYGLAAPSFRIDARHESGLEVHLDVGAVLERDGTRGVWVRPREEPHVFLAEAEPLERLAVDRESYRTARVFDFEGLEIVRVDAKGPGGAIGLERVESAAGAAAAGSEAGDPVRDRWRVHGLPGGKSLPGDTSLCGIAIAELRELLIQKFTEGEGEVTYDRVLTVTLEDGQKHELEIGPRSDDPRDEGLEMYLARRPADGARFLIETFWPHRLDVGPWVFHDRSASEVAASDVYEVRLERGEDRWTLVRVPNQGWDLPQSVDVRRDMTLDQKLVQEVVNALDREKFRVWKFEPGLPRDRYEYWGIGRNEFRMAIEMTYVDGDAGGFRRLTIGHEQPASEPLAFYGRIDSPDMAVTLTEKVPALVERLVDHLAALTAE